jgi:hypothetical protein
MQIPVRAGGNGVVFDEHLAFLRVEHGQVAPFGFAGRGDL